MHRAIIAAAALLVAVPAGAASPKPPFAMVITKLTVIDGDTFKAGDRTIRLYGIDAPESEQQCSRGGKQWKCGQEAAHALAEKIGNNMVLCQIRSVDRNDRYVSVCGVPGPEDMKSRKVFEAWAFRLSDPNAAGSINGWLVSDGWALAYRKYSTAYVDEEAEAREARRGIWASEFAPPWDWRKRQREGTRSTPLNPAGHRRHRPGPPPNACAARSAGRASQAGRKLLHFAAVHLPQGAGCAC